MAPAALSFYTIFNMFLACSLSYQNMNQFIGLNNSWIKKSVLCTKFWDITVCIKDNHLITPSFYNFKVKRFFYWKVPFMCKTMISKKPLHFKSFDTKPYVALVWCNLYSIYMRILTLSFIDYIVARIISFPFSY